MSLGANTSSLIAAKGRKTPKWKWELLVLQARVEENQTAKSWMWIYLPKRWLLKSMATGNISPGSVEDYPEIDMF